jgi:hypothetical protein
VRALQQRRRGVQVDHVTQHRRPQDAHLHQGGAEDQDHAQQGGAWQQLQFF